jgi:uncharacterized phage protein gp47/JayE
MPWPLITLRDRRAQVRDDLSTHLPGSDATVPNSVLRAVAESQASLTHDNDLHLDWVARMMMPDTAEGEFADRWGNIWLPDGRKAASYATGAITVTGSIGAAVPTGAELTATIVDADGQRSSISFEIVAGVTLSSTSAAVAVLALDAGVAGNLEEGAQLSFVTVPSGIDGVAVIAAPGFSGGADVETDAALIERYIARIQEPPHGGAVHDYVAWTLDIPGVTRAWAAQEMGVGTITVRFILDDVRAPTGIPLAGDLAIVLAHLDALRPVTVGQLYVLAPIAQPLNLTITDLANDRPEVRTNIGLELAEMLRARARPGGIIYASWIVEAIAAATGEDHHDATVSNVVPTSAGHIITPGTLTFT